MRDRSQILVTTAVGAVMTALLVQGCSTRDVVGVTVGDVEVTPTSATLTVGDERSFAAAVRDEDGNPLPGAAVSWSSDAPAVASVDAEGRVEAIAPGEARVRASTQGVAGEALVTVEAEPTLEIQVDSAELFASLGGGGTSAEIRVTNGGSGSVRGLGASVDYEGGQPVGWLTPELSSTFTPATLRITASAASLQEGEYRATVRLSASDPPSLVELPVTLSVTQDSPIISLSPSAVGFAVVQGGGEAPVEAVRITNAGGGALAGLAVSVDYEAEAGWLDVAMSRNAAPADLALTARARGLGPGTYRAGVLVTAPGAVNSPAVLRVSLNVEPEPRADLKVSKTAPGAGVVGDTLAFVVEVRNAGPRTARGVEVVDSLPRDLTYLSATGGGDQVAGVVRWTVGELVAGESRTDTVWVRPDAPGSYQNVARASTTTLDPVPGNDRHTAGVTIRLRDADLEVDKVGPAEAALGDTLTYVITTVSSGPGAAGDVVVTDSLPEGLEVVWASEGGVISGSVVTWSVDSLVAGAARVDSVRALVTGSGSLTDVARARTGTPEPDSLDNRATVTTAVDGRADLQVVKAGPATAAVGDTVTYVLTTTNLGPGPAEQVVVVDSLPGGVTGISAAPNGTLAGGVATFPAATLAAGESRVDTVRVRMESGGSFTDVARASTVTPDADGANDRDTLTTTVEEEDEADISVSQEAPAAAQVGDTLTWVLRVANAGPDAVTDLTVVDSLPDGVDLVSATGDPESSGGVLTWSGRGLPAGAERVDTVRALAVEVGTAVNVLRASSPVADPDQDDLRSQATTEVSAPASADLSVDKDGPNKADRGEPVSYEIEVRNAGPDAALDVEVVDSLPPGMTLVLATLGAEVDGRRVTWRAGTLSAGEQRSYSLTLLAQDNGSTYNVARVSSATPDPDEDDLRDEVKTVVGGSDADDGDDDDGVSDGGAVGTAAGG